MENQFDVIIIGSGPAGLGAAIYGARAGLKMAVIEKSPISGGQVLTTYEVDNYLGFPGISGSELCTKFREHADALKVPFLEEEVLQIQVNEDRKMVITQDNTYDTKTIIVATGANHSKLNVKGEEALSGMGVSYCATCDGAFFRNREVAVIGGGNVAVEDAIFLAGICRKVYLVHRRDELRAEKSLQEKLFTFDNVEFCWNQTVTEIIGKEQVEAIRLKNVKDGSETQFTIDGVFIAVGIVPETKLFSNIFQTDEKGYALTGEDCETTCPGVFAAGDIRKKPLRQIITAVADGANAIAGVQKYLHGMIK